jgi:CspA family cold shock protein
MTGDGWILNLNPPKAWKLSKYLSGMLNSYLIGSISIEPKGITGKTVMLNSILNQVVKYQGRLILNHLLMGRYLLNSETLGGLRLSIKHPLEGTMMKGTVRRWLDKRGFGFITPDGNTDEDIFVHWTAVEGDGGYVSLVEGQRVRFDVEKVRQGLQARNVRYEV